MTDAGIRELRGLRALLSLDLHGTQLTDSALATVKDFIELAVPDPLPLQCHRPGLEQLKEVTSLRSLKLVSTATTDAGVADLQRC